MASKSGALQHRPEVVLHHQPRNKEDPGKWWVPEEVMLIPPEEEIDTQGALQKASEGVKDFFDSSFKNMSSALKNLTPSTK